MAWNGNHPVTKKPWKERQHERSEENLTKFSDALKELIEEHEGVYVGNLTDILRKANLDDTYYGDIVNDIGIVTKRLGVTVDGPSRKRRYIYNEILINKKININPNKNDVIDQIKFLLSNTDINILTSDESKSMLKIIKVLCDVS